MGLFDFKRFEDSTSSKNHMSPFGEAGLLFDPLAYIGGDKYRNFMRKTWEKPNEWLSPYAKKFHAFERKNPWINPLQAEIDKTEFGGKIKGMSENKPGDAALAIMGAAFGGGALLGGGGGSSAGGFQGYGEMGGFQPSSDLGIFGNGGQGGMGSVGQGNMGNLVNSPGVQGISQQGMTQQMQMPQQQQEQPKYDAPEYNPRPSNPATTHVTVTPGSPVYGRMIGRVMRRYG